jgi:hypothetical protein
MLNDNGTWNYIETFKQPNNSLVYEDGVVKVSFQDGRIYQPKYSKSFQTEIELSVTVITNTKIINPKTHTIYGYEEGSDIGGTMPVGFHLSDSFGNDMKVSAVSPKYIGYKEQGLRPGQTQIFKIVAKDYPLEKSLHIVLKIQKNVLGNNKTIIMEIPTDKIRRLSSTNN